MKASLERAISITELAATYGGLIANPDTEFSALAIDSREIVEGDLFVALEGVNADGHQFCQQAVNSGASALLVNRYQAGLKVTQWIVEDTLEALGSIAQFYRCQFTLSVIAITGSNGKTTTKEMLRAILSAQFGRDYGNYSVVTEKNYNNEIGVAFTLMRIHSQTRIAVIEMGARQTGDIERLCRWARPTIALVTNVGVAHLGVFGSVQAIIDAKGEIYNSVDMLETAVLNMDSEGYQQFEYQTKPLTQIKVSTKSVRQRQAADIWASQIKDRASGVSFTLHIYNNSSEVQLNVLGRHNVSNALAAVACAWSAGIEVLAMIHGLGQFKAIEGRLSLQNYAAKGYLIDDSYNANPNSMMAAIDALLLQKGNKIMVLGDMGELGEDAVKRHQALLDYALSKTDERIQILLLGTIWGKVDVTGNPTHKIQRFEDKAALLVALNKLLNDTTITLLKGSRFMQMETIIDSLFAGQVEPSTQRSNLQSTIGES